MIRISAVAAVVLVLGACSPAPPSVPSTAPASKSIELHAGDRGPVDLPAGRYRVSWTADCSVFFVEWAPSSGVAPVEVFRSDRNVEPTASGFPSGSVVVNLPGGPAYVNRGGICPGDYVVRIEPA